MVNGTVALISTKSVSQGWNNGNPEKKSAPSAGPCSFGVLRQTAPSRVRVKRGCPLVSLQNNLKKGSWLPAELNTDFLSADRVPEPEPIAPIETRRQFQRSVPAALGRAKPSVSVKPGNRDAASRESPSLSVGFDRMACPGFPFRAAVKAA